MKVKFKEVSVDYKVICITITIVSIILYYINPLINIDLTEWDRTFCLAMLDGISIEKRIQNLYLTIVFVTPLLGILFGACLSVILKEKEEYKNALFKMDTILLFAVFIAYLSRFNPEDSSIISNVLLEATIVYQSMLLFISFIDKKSKLNTDQMYYMFVVYLITGLTLNILLRSDTIVSILLTGVLVGIFFVFIIKIPQIQNKYQIIENIFNIFLWLPFGICILLEGLYFLNEKGYKIKQYYSIVACGSLIYIFLGIGLVWLWRNKDKSLKSIEYLGAILSIGGIRYLYNPYQMIWEYVDYANVYELGNSAVAVDTIINGKIPIIDYFSAHALHDVWTRILYCVLHSDIKGIFTDPYGGVNNILSLIILFFILKELFDEDLAILFVCLSPTVGGVKISSICFVSILAMIHAVKKNTYKSYLTFWSATLIGAFILYDEGISLGLGSIIAILSIKIFEKDYKKIKEFLGSGCAVAISALTLYFIYCKATGINSISRIKEWLAVSVGSNSTWALSNFGDVGSLAFFVSYFLAPMTAVSVLIVSISFYVKDKEHSIFAALAIAFSIGEILYITRTVVYHNLALTKGWTGVLLNFVHWTISSFILYLCIKQKKEKERTFLVWSLVFTGIILAEGVLVTERIPDPKSAVYNAAVDKSEGMKLSNDMSSIWNQERNIYSEETKVFIKQFDDIFNLLLEEEETFLDFSNITSLYALTNRVRPFYVGQSPSLLTNIESQKFYLEEIKGYSIPLAIMGRTKDPYTMNMVYIPHNIRYYTIAEYIYNTYCPLIAVGDFAIWCEFDKLEKYRSILAQSILMKDEKYQLIDYGYDATTIIGNENGNSEYHYQAYRPYNLGMTAYVWANYDKYEAIENRVIVNAEVIEKNKYSFAGSQNIDNLQGNYIAFECKNISHDNFQGTIILEDCNDSRTRYEYRFTILPGENSYLIRVSQDYFWKAFNINSIIFSGSEEYEVNNVRILEGD